MALITRLSRLCDLAYEAAEGGSWTDFVSEAAQVFGSAQASLMTDIPDRGSGRPEPGQSHSIGNPTNEWYPDPSTDQIMEGTWGQPRGRISLIQNVANRNEHGFSEPYRAFLRSVGLNHLVLVMLPQDPGRVAMFTLVRTTEQPPFSGEEIEAVEALVPHLRRALRMAARTETQVPRENLFERSAYGLILFDAQGRCLELNELAREIVNADDGLRQQGDNLIVEGIRDLPALIASLVQRAPDFGPAILSIERRKTDKPLAALVVPAPQEWDQVRGQEAAVVMIVGDPDRASSPGQEVLMAHYGLTRSEARLARALVEMRTLKAAGAKLGIAPETARHHIKAVFHKTRTHGQAELVRLLVSHPTTLFTAIGGAKAPVLLSGEN